MTDILIKTGHLDTEIHIRGKDVKMKGEYSHLQTRRETWNRSSLRDLRRIKS